jgi:hypothetical protein
MMSHLLRAANRNVQPSSGDCVEFRARLPKDEAALLIAAINTARDEFGPPPAKPDLCGDARQEPTPGVGSYGNADALVDVAREFLNTAPEDGSGEDRPAWQSARSWPQQTVGE